jgi:hypothetical protein
LMAKVYHLIDSSTTSENYLWHISLFRNKI